MRLWLIGAAVLLASCGPTSLPSTEQADSKGADVEQLSQWVQELRERQLAGDIGPNCENAHLSEGLTIADKVPAASPNQAADQIEVERSEKFGPLFDLVGRCYKGTPTDESAEKTADIQYWGWALGGAAITIEHALEDGSYGGISYVYPKPGSDDFTYVYITNAEFHTQGTITLNDDQSFTASETVNGHPTITEVRSITTFDETGITSLTSEFLDDGTWKAGPRFTHELTKQPFPRLQTPQTSPPE